MKSYLQALSKAGAEVYLVGGVVRDALLGRATTDSDYICRLLSVEQISNILAPLGKVNLVGQSFGVIKFAPFADEATVDIALPRKEISTGTGHRDFNVDFDPTLPLELDLGRRDFTINAMARNVLTQELIDPFHGQEDLKRKLIRVVFPRAFEEDPLRMLRAVQFAARFGFTLETNTFALMCKDAALIKTVSPERIIEELRKLMSAPKPSIGFRLMLETGLLQHVMPDLSALTGVSQDKLPNDNVFEHTMRVLDAARSDSELLEPGEINLMFAALLHDIGKPKTAQWLEDEKRMAYFGHQIVSARLARKWMQKMRVETIGVTPELVLNLVEQHMFETKAYFSERAIRRFIAKIGKDDILKLLDLRLADNRGGKYPNGIKGVQRLRKRIQEELEKKPPFGPKDLAISGHDIMAAGIPEGRMVGQILKDLVEVVLDEPEKNTREQLLELVAKTQTTLSTQAKKS